MVPIKWLKIIEKLAETYKQKDLISIFSQGERKNKTKAIKTGSRQNIWIT